MPNQSSGLARLVVGYQHFLLPIEDATKAFIALGNVEIITYDYNSKGYKPESRAASSDGAVQLHSFTVTDLAVLELNRSSETP